MFDRTKYVTAGINRMLEIETQMFLWKMILDLEGERDYLQVFELVRINENKIKITHRQEEPDYENVTVVNVAIPQDFIKVFVIDDGDYSTMLLASEY